MSEVKHSPGPWEVECVMCDEVNGEAYEVHADGGAISIAAPPSEADAYLIAAAPDLLAVAKAYERWEEDLILCDKAWGGGMAPMPTLTHHDRLMEVLAMRNAAIRKATGAG